MAPTEDGGGADARHHGLTLGVGHPARGGPLVAGQDLLRDRDERQRLDADADRVLTGEEAFGRHEQVAGLHVDLHVLVDARGDELVGDRLKLVEERLRLDIDAGVLVKRMGRVAHDDHLGDAVLAGPEGPGRRLAEGGSLLLVHRSLQKLRRLVARGLSEDDLVGANLHLGVRVVRVGAEASAGAEQDEHGRLQRPAEVGRVGVDVRKARSGFDCSHQSSVGSRKEIGFGVCARHVHRIST